MTALAPVIEKLPDKGVKVDAAIIAKPFRDEIKAKVQELKKQGIGACILLGVALVWIRDAHDENSHYSHLHITL